MLCYINTTTCVTILKIALNNAYISYAPFIKIRTITATLLTRFLDRNFSHRKSSQLEFVFFSLLFIYFKNQKKSNFTIHTVLFLWFEYLMWLFITGNKCWQNNSCSVYMLLKKKKGGGAIFIFAYDISLINCSAIN